MKLEVDWKPKLKGYPHFDAPISSDYAVKIATDPSYVKHHKFLPFLSYSSKSRKFTPLKKLKKELYDTAPARTLIYIRIIAVYF